MASNAPVQVPNLSDVKSVSTRFGHNCAVEGDGSLWCWGRNNKGQLGIGSTDPMVGPVQVVGMASGVVQASVGDGHSCAVKTDGSLWCWGDNGSGQVGNDSNMAAPSPVMIMAGGVAEVQLGHHRTCAVMSDSSLWCWGGGSGDSQVPVQVSDLGNTVAGTSLGIGHTCAYDENNTLWCWGSNSAGELGDGPGVPQPTLVEVLDLVDHVAAGDLKTCARKVDASLWCWGHNVWGQLGDGTQEARELPVPVSFCP